MSTLKYTYEHLEDSVNQIRLVSLVQNHDRKHIRLKLESVLIDQAAGKYEAVSYMWGPERPRRQVTIDGKTQVVRDSIWRCLKHLRDHKLVGSRLWIDSICIKQSDDHEKAQQVANMGRIFANASRVLIWLGSTSLQTYLTVSATDLLPGNIKYLPPENHDLWMGLLGQSDHATLSLVNQIMSIVYNTYWERLWIIQELALARNVGLVFGNTLLGRKHLRTTYFTARENSKPGYRAWIVKQRDPNILFSGTHILDHHPMNHICSRRHNELEDPAMETFEVLIRRYHWQQCTDPRDYVYGLDSLLDPRAHFKIDYTASKELVAARALLYLREEGRNKACNDPGSDFGLNFESAAAMIKALTVTAASYATFENNLPIEQRVALQESRLDIKCGPMPSGALMAGEILAAPIDNAPKVVARLNISGTLVMNIYESQRQIPLQVKLLDGRYQQFHRAQVLDEAREGEVQLVLCLMSFSVLLITCQSSTDATKIALKHYLAPDYDRHATKGDILLEKKMSPALQKAFEREFDNCSIGWQDLMSDTQPRISLRFSILEVVSMSEVSAVKKKTFG